MILNDNILDRLTDKIGQDVRTPEGATILALDLQNEYKDRAPSVNTVKRMVGRLPDGNIRPSTLNLIANYLSFPSWDILKENSEAQGSGFGRSDIFIDMTEVEEDAEVEVAWRPDRRLLLRHDGCGQYRVIKSENCKLLPGDLLSLSTLAIGYPFVAEKVFRGERPLGRYRAADGSTLHLLNILSD